MQCIDGVRERCTEQPLESGLPPILETRKSNQVEAG
jgi:hypothetical protein